MNKRFADAWLVVMATVLFGGSVAAMFAYSKLGTPLKEMVFSSFFLGPALALYGGWRILKKDVSLSVVTSTILSIMTTLLWVYTIQIWLKKAAG